MKVLETEMTIIWIGLDTEDLSEPSFQVEASSGPIGWGKKLRGKRLVQIFTNIDVSKREALCFLRNNMGKRLDLLPRMRMDMQRQCQKFVESMN